MSETLAYVVYILCALTSTGCTFLLIGRYRKTRVDLLFWSALAFFLFTVTNVLLVVDLVIFPNISMSNMAILRTGISLIGVGVLLYGLIRNSTS